jgi:hypothetical protein
LPTLTPIHVCAPARRFAGKPTPDEAIFADHVHQLLAVPLQPTYLLIVACRFAGKPTPDEAIFATMYASASSQKGLYPGWDKDLHYAVRWVRCHGCFLKVRGGAEGRLYPGWDKDLHCAVK